MENSSSASNLELVQKCSKNIKCVKYWSLRPRFAKFYKWINIWQIWASLAIPKQEFFI
jgi:hypothetical protein